MLTQAQLANKLVTDPVSESDDEEENEGDKVLGEEIDEDGDPPRVWSPRGDYPGAAVTRSIGDELAEVEAGVIAEPEVFTRELTSNDKVVFLASDGVYEVSVVCIIML